MKITKPINVMLVYGSGITHKVIEIPDGSYAELGSGILDYEGNEIFSGDLVKDEKYGELFEVEYTEGAFFFFQVDYVGRNKYPAPPCLWRDIKYRRVKKVGRWRK